MNRYKKANEGIHAPEELKHAVLNACKKPSHAKWVSAVAAVLAVALVAGIVLWPGNTPVAHAAGVLAEAAYPESVPAPDVGDYTKGGKQDWKAYNEAASIWAEADRERRKSAPERDVMDEFCADILPELLGNSGGENLVCSPMNLYMALAMLAEVTDGDSREQILELLGADSVKEVRNTANRLFTSSYREDGQTTLRPAASLWLREDTGYVQETLDLLAEKYYASSYSGEMGSGEFNKALRDWLNRQTGGKLKEYADGMEFHAETVLAIAATLYFKASWDSEFREENNTKDVFHGADGDETVTFLNQTAIDSVYWGEGFAAYAKPLAAGDMWFILPDEGVSVDELLTSGRAAEFLSEKNEWEDQGAYTVNLSLPKFDVSSKIDLTDSLKKLGVTDVFDPALSDFTPMTDVDELYLSTASHAVRVSVDEQGVEGAAFTILMADAAGARRAEDEVDFVLDRPFIFAVTSDTGHLLFVGVVNRV